MNRLDIFTTMEQIVRTITDVPTVILADQLDARNGDVPAPTGEYASIEPMMSITERGQANIHRATSLTPQSVDVDARAQIMVECSINFYRGNARDRAQRLLQANKRSDISAILFKAKLGWNRTNAINNLTALQANNHEQRAQLSIFLMYETTDPIVINSIESVDFSVENEKAEVLETGTVTSSDPFL